MRKKKKNIVLLIAVGVCFSLVGCGDKELNSQEKADVVLSESENSEEEKNNELNENNLQEMEEYYSNDEEIDAVIENQFVIDESKMIEYCEWLDEAHSIYRISVGSVDEPADEYSHLEDYFFVKSSKDVRYFKVDYPSKNDSLESDRYVYDACDFTAYYEDVTFDGEKDIVISLGHQGASGTEVHCAYVYDDGEYIYKKSFEEIPNYRIDTNEKCIIGTYEEIESKYLYVDGEFVQQ